MSLWGHPADYGEQRSLQQIKTIGTSQWCQGGREILKSVVSIRNNGDTYSVFVSVLSRYGYWLLNYVLSK